MKKKIFFYYCCFYLYDDLSFVVDFIDMMNEWMWLCWTEVGPASMIVGNLVAGKRIAQACGRDVAQLEDNDQARKVEIHPSSISPTHHPHIHAADTGMDP